MCSSGYGLRAKRMTSHYDHGAWTFDRTYRFSTSNTLRGVVVVDAVGFFPAWDAAPPAATLHTAPSRARRPVRVLGCDGVLTCGGFGWGDGRLPAIMCPGVFTARARCDPVFIASDSL